MRVHYNYLEGLTLIVTLEVHPSFLSFFLSLFFFFFSLFFSYPQLVAGLFFSSSAFVLGIVYIIGRVIYGHMYASYGTISYCLFLSGGLIF